MDAPMSVWRRVAAEVRSRRSELDLTQDAASRRSGGRVSRATWQKIEAASEMAYTTRTLIGVCRSLRWSDDSIHRIAKGLEPQIVEGDEFSTPITRSVYDAIKNDPQLDDLARSALLDVYRGLVADVAERR
jgi:hypothetical protein